MRYQFPTNFPWYKLMIKKTETYFILFLLVSNVIILDEYYYRTPVIKDSLLLLLLFSIYNIVHIFKALKDYYLPGLSKYSREAAW